MLAIALSGMPFCMARLHIWISSPACAPTMPAPRILPRFRGDDLQKTTCLALGLRAHVLAIGPAQDGEPPIALARRLLGHADMGQLPGR